MEHRKSVLNQSKPAGAKPQAVVDSVHLYVFVCSHVFPRGEIKKFSLQFSLDISSSDCDRFLTGKCEMKKDRLFTKVKQTETRYIYTGLKTTDLLI